MKAVYSIRDAFADSYESAKRHIEQLENNIATNRPNYQRHQEVLNHLENLIGSIERPFALKKSDDTQFALHSLTPEHANEWLADLPQRHKKFDPAERDVYSAVWIASVTASHFGEALQNNLAKVGTEQERSRASAGRHPFF